MTCEKAEEHLSAYLDDMLAPQLRQEVAAHVEGCDLCSGILEDYRRFDQLLAMDRREEPPAELRARIFDSPEFAEILAQANRERRSALPLLRTIGQSPGWARAALSVAALVALFLGSALLIKQGFFHPGASSTHISRPIAGQNSTPLAQGARVIYAHDGALWSAPEIGRGLAERLTPQDLHVGAWSVAPDGMHVAYVDVATGRIHVIRSDNQNDTPTHSVSLSTYGAALAWSPDGARIAYLAGQPGGVAALHLMNADGTNDEAVDGATAVSSAPVWSPDSLLVAYAQDTNDGQRLVVYNAVTKQTRILGQVEGLIAAGGLHWLSPKSADDALHPAVTWATTDGAGHFTGIFLQPALDSAKPRRLTPSGALYGAADFNPAYKGGAWLVSSVEAAGKLALISVAGDATPHILARGTVYTHLVWSARGDAAALLLAETGRLALWTPESGVKPIAAGMGGVLGVAWAPDGQGLAIATPGAVFVSADGGVTFKLVELATAEHGTLSWSLVR